MDLDFIKRQIDILISNNDGYLNEDVSLPNVVKYLDQVTSLDELKPLRTLIFDQLSVLDEINAYFVEDGKITDKEKLQSKELVSTVNKISIKWFEELN